MTDAETIEDWARRYVASTDLAFKLAPPAPPRAFAAPRPTAERLARPGRPEVLVAGKTKRSLRFTELQSPAKRARLLHVFHHHELQAAELMCWALLAFPDTPDAFRRGLLGICLDEIRHMRMYADRLEAMGFAVGAFPVRDWLWERGVTCATPLQFVALLGIGFEGGNLDHTQRFAAGFREVGDEDGAVLQEHVGREEVAHVRFAVRWFRKWAGGGDAIAFDRWRAELPPPLTPTMLQGRPVNASARREAGLDDAFVAELAAWDAVKPGS